MQIEAVMKVVIALLPALCLASVTALANPCSSPRYNTIGNRSEYVSTVTKRLTVSINKIEAVPPSESEYIDKEFNSAMEDGNVQRRILVISRPFYHTHELRKSLEEFNGSISLSVYSKNVKQQAVSYASALSALSDIRINFDNYYGIDQRRSPPVLNKEKVDDILWQIPVSRVTLEQALRCAIEELKEP